MGSQNSTSSPNSPNSSSSPSSSSGQTKQNFSGKKNNNNRNWKGNSNSGSSGQSNASGSNAPKLHAKHLGPDGKLKPEELEWHQKFKLCLFCGGKHKLEECNVWKVQASASACTATSQEPELPAIAEVPEN